MHFSRSLQGMPQLNYCIKYRPIRYLLECIGHNVIHLKQLIFD